MTRDVRRAVAWALVAAGFGSVAAWLLFSAACLYSADLPLCRHPNGGWIVMALTVVLSLLPLAFTARERARRAVGRGMYARPVGLRRSADWGGMFQNVARLVIEGEWQADPLRHPMLDVSEHCGWDVPLADGTAVRVYWHEMYIWLRRAWEFQQDPANRHRGATSQNTWDAEIGRPQTLARNELLEMAGAIRRNKTSANSIRRIVGTPWSIMAELYEIWPPGELR